MRFINAIQSLDNQVSYPFDMGKWNAYARSISDGLCDKCVSDANAYNFDHDILPVLSAALKSKERMKRLSGLFDALSNELEERLSLLFEDMLEASVVLYLGLCNGAGWATELNGRDVVLLGAEKILELNWDTDSQLRALMYHEIGHIWHKNEGCDFEPHSTQESALRWVFREGMAMVCEQILYGDESYYHQGRLWANWCQENLSAIKQEYDRRLKNGYSVQDFFGDWSRFMDQPDVGYYLGAQFIRFLMTKHTLKEAASLPCDILMKEFEAFACE